MGVRWRSVRCMGEVEVGEVEVGVPQIEAGGARTPLCRVGGVEIRLYRVY